jgi:hypothetical protein
LFGLIILGASFVAKAPYIIQGRVAVPACSLGFQGKQVITLRNGQLRRSVRVFPGVVSVIHDLPYQE